MGADFQPDNKRSLDPRSGERSPLSSGQAALRYHFEDLIREHHAERPLEGALAARGAGILSRLLDERRIDAPGSEARILAGGMTDGSPAEAFILSQLRSRENGYGDDCFVLPLLGDERRLGGAHLAPWTLARRQELFSAPVGLIGHLGSPYGDDVFPVYSPQAQEEALDHVEQIAADVNTCARSGATSVGHVAAASLLLARVLDTVVASNAAGDPDVYGAASKFGGPPLLSIFHLGIDRNKDVLFSVDVLAIRVGDKISSPGGKPLFSGALFLKEYTVSARRGPLAFENIRVVDLVERAA